LNSNLITCLLQQRSKARRNCFLNCPAKAGLRAPIKKKEIFAGFAYRRQAVSRWAGLFKIRKRILFKESSNLVQKAPPNFNFRISQK